MSEDEKRLIALHAELRQFGVSLVARSMARLRDTAQNRAERMSKLEKLTVEKPENKELWEFLLKKDRRLDETAARGLRVFTQLFEEALTDIKTNHHKMVNLFDST